MPIDLDRDTIYVTLAGSQAHGTYHEGSDVDLRGVFIAPMAVRVSLFKKADFFEGPIEGVVGARILEQIQRHRAASRGLIVKVESALFDVAKFLSLCAAANPNALEILFASEEDWMYETPKWRLLYSVRHRFLTQKIRQTFLGYAMAQLKRIETHRSWLLRPPRGKPTRAEFGLPDSSTLSPDDRDRIEHAITEKLRTYGIDSIEMPVSTRMALQENLRFLLQDLLETPEDDLDERLRSLATGALHLPKNTELALSAERKYRAAMKHWNAFATWQATRNPARAGLERKHGYDTKHAMHLVRLMRAGLEALVHGDLAVRRPDAAELSAIRDGALSYDALMTLASDLKARMAGAAHDTSLPLDVHPEFVDGLLLELIQAHS